MGGLLEAGGLLATSGLYRALICEPITQPHPCTGHYLNIKAECMSESISEKEMAGPDLLSGSRLVLRRSKRVRYIDGAAEERTAYPWEEKLSVLRHVEGTVDFL